jgi:hypothetical protein
LEDGKVDRAVLGAICSILSEAKEIFPEKMAIAKSTHD